MARLKKGSKEAKAWGKKMKLARQRKNKIPSYSIKRTTKKMAKKRTTRRRGTSYNGAKKPLSILFGAGLYGAMRQYIDGFVKPLTSKIPLGTIADEVVLFTGSYLLDKKVKDKTAKQVFQAGMIVEGARIGEAIADGSAFAGFGKSSNGASLTQFSTLG